MGDEAADREARGAARRDSRETRGRQRAERIRSRAPQAAVVEARRVRRGTRHLQPRNRRVPQGRVTTPGRAEPGRSRGETLPDLLGPHTRLLFVGVNPGLSAVAVQAPFPRRGNRFYPALFKAGITDRLIDASAGFAPGDREYLTDRGIGITALVSRATARARAERGGTPSRRPGPARDRYASQAASSRHSGDHRVSHRLRQAGSQHRPAARTVRRNTALGRAQPERPQRSLLARRPGGRLSRSRHRRRARSRARGRLRGQPRHGRHDRPDNGRTH